MTPFAPALACCPRRGIFRRRVLRRGPGAGGGAAGARSAHKPQGGLWPPRGSGCRKSGLRHFFEVFIAPLRLRRGQGAMQGNPCYARLFADLTRMSPNPIKASGGCGPRTPGALVSPRGCRAGRPGSPSGKRRRPPPVPGPAGMRLERPPWPKRKEEIQLFTCFPACGAEEQRV